MFQVKVATILFASLVCTSTFAGTFLQKATQTKSSVEVSSMPMVDTYPAFSGTWVGQCDDVAGETTLIIKSSLTKLNINGGIDLIMDEYNTLGASSKHSGFSSLLISVFWDNNKTSIKGNMVDVSTRLNKQPLSTSIEDFTLSLNDNGELILKENYKEFKGTEEMYNTPSQCIFKRVK